MIEDGGGGRRLPHRLMSLGLLFLWWLLLFVGITGATLALQAFLRCSCP